MGTRKRSCKYNRLNSKEQEISESRAQSNTQPKSIRRTIKKSKRTKTSSMVRQSMGKKWTLQEEVRLLALFVAVGPDWGKISSYLEDRQPSTIKCKLNNMLRYALVGANDRVDDVGKFTKRIASEIKSKSYTLFQYHSQHLSKLPLAKMEPFLRNELDVILPQIKSQMRREAAERRVAANNARENTKSTVYQLPQSVPTPQQSQSALASDYSDVPLPQSIAQPLFNVTFPYHSVHPEPAIQWRPLPYDYRSLYQSSLSETPLKMLQPGIEHLSTLYPPPSTGGLRSTPLSAFSSLDPPYNNEICGYSLKVPIS